MNAKQRRTHLRKFLTHAKSLGITVPRWVTQARVEQLIREEMNRRRKAKSA